MIRVIAGSSKNDTLVDPCAPKGYSHKIKVTGKTSAASPSNLENQYVDNGSGNFKECRSSSLMMMQEGKGKKCMRTLRSLIFISVYGYLVFIYISCLYYSCA